MKDYPDDAMPFYAQGFSLVEYLLERGREFDDSEHRRLVHFADSAMQNGDWQSALHVYYGVANLGELQTSWVKWVGTDDQALKAVAAVPNVTLPSIAMQVSNIAPVAQTSAKPLPPLVGQSVYEQQWDGDNSVLLPASFGRNVVLR